MLAEKLLLNRKNMGLTVDDATEQAAQDFCGPYKAFLDACKTEREAVAHIVEMVQKQGYQPFEPGKAYQPGEKIYYNNRGKALILCTMGKKPLSEGVRIMASHVDSPRLDLKPVPLHGVIIKKNGETLNVALGEDPEEPAFTITDLLPHLAKEQMKRTLQEGVKGEELNVLVGCRPFKDDKQSERVKLNIMRLLNEKYGIIESDFLSAELTMVPAFRARDIGLDRSMIGAYGHDDRVCAYTSLMAALECDAPEQTILTVFADKEETGSDGNTGLHSRFMAYFIEDLARPFGLSAGQVLSHSNCLSADVNAAFDPTYPDTLEKRNCAYLNYGVVITQYTGSGGKSSTSQASAEFMAQVRNILDEANVSWQTGELGKVDAGGGGTVAKFVAAFNVDVGDVGVPVLSMHAPFEIVSKLDVYSTYQAFRAYVNA